MTDPVAEKIAALRELVGVTFGRVDGAGLLAALDVVEAAGTLTSAATEQSRLADGPDLGKWHDCVTRGEAASEQLFVLVETFAQEDSP